MTGRRTEPEEVTLREAAAILDVHYMTAYRYVRTGRLPATRVGGEWRVRRADLDRFTAPPRTGRAAPATSGAVQRRLVERLVAGDEPGAWALIEAAVVGGREPVDVHLELLAPALRAIGEGWADGSITVDEEHRASAVAHRLVGRLGPRFLRPGRRRGTVVLAGAPGDTHALPVALAADVVRAARYGVVDLGAAVPPTFLARTVAATDRLLAVGICVSVSGNDPDVREAVAAAKAAAPGVPVLLGGAGIDAAAAASLGADGHAGDAAELVALLDAGRASR